MTGLLDRVLNYLAEHTLKSVTVQKAVPALSADAHGYWTVDYSLPPRSTIVAVDITTGNIGNSKGLQVIPIAHTNGLIYINYYAAAAIAANKVTLTCRIWYYNY